MAKDTFPGRGEVLNSLSRTLESEGYTRSFLKGIIPDWWSRDAEEDSDALAELKIILARRVGLDVEGILSSGCVTPIAPVGVRFKRSAQLQGEPPPDPTLAFCGVVGRAIASTLKQSAFLPPNPDIIRDEILAEPSIPFVSLETLVEYCWARNIAVVHLAELPTARKGMEALTARFDQRDVIIMTRQSNVPAWASFHLAHELGHIALKHVRNNEVLVDEEQDLKGEVNIQEERDADKFAADLLAGGNIRDFWSRYDSSPQTFAEAVLNRANKYRVDPAHVILRYGRLNGFRFANAALKYLGGEAHGSARGIINDAAAHNIDLALLPGDTGELISRVLTST